MSCRNTTLIFRLTNILKSVYMFEASLSAFILVLSSFSGKFEVQYDLGFWLQSRAIVVVEQHSAYQLSGEVALRGRKAIASLCIQRDELLRALQHRCRRLWRLLFIAQYANTRLPHGPLFFETRSPDGRKHIQRVLVSENELLLRDSSPKI